MCSLFGRRVPVLLGAFMLLVVVVAPRGIASQTAPVASSSGAAVLLSSPAGDAVLAAKPEPREWGRAHRVGHVWPLSPVTAVAAVAAAVLRWSRLSALTVGRARLAVLCFVGAIRAPPRLRLA
jgi:hypothetical protein